MEKQSAFLRKTRKLFRKKKQSLENLWEWPKLIWRQPNMNANGTFDIIKLN